MKLLFNLLDMDGTIHTWLEEPTDAGGTFRSEMAAGVSVQSSHVRLLPLGGSVGQVFSLAEYIDEQPERTQETARRMPLMLQMVQQLNVDLGKSQPFHERTLKSYLLQEAEGISRSAKLQWCSQHGCTGINLQHDGVVIRLTGDWTNADAEEELSRVSTAASGYVQTVETKAWPPGIVFDAQLEARYADANGQGDDEASPCVRVLQTAFEYISGRDMIPKPRAPVRDASGEPESKWVSFQRRYNIPYLYGLIKTHKMPFGWRFISGGTNLAMNLIGDWMHACLSGLLDETHHLASKAMSGAWGEDPMPCLESFIIRDSRDVVRRIRDLETRRRAAYRAHADGTATKPPHWRRVQFEVADFTTLYPSLPHDLILGAIAALLNRIFTAKRKGNTDGSTEPRYLRVSRGKTGPDSMHTAWVEGQRVNGVWQPPGDNRSVKYFTAEIIMRDLRFILANTYMTVGDELHRQVCGVPMGLACSPMIAVLMLAHYEIRMLEWMRRNAERPLGVMVDTPRGRVPLTASSRDALLSLACRLSRCCRAIDDVLFIDMSASERRWATSRMYPSALELKTVCSSPGVIQYLTESGSLKLSESPIHHPSLAGWLVPCYSSTYTVVSVLPRCTVK